MGWGDDGSDYRNFGHLLRRVSTRMQEYLDSFVRRETYTVIVAVIVGKYINCLVNSSYRDSN